MSAQNLSHARWMKAQGTYMPSYSATVTGSQAVLHNIIIGTYAPGAKFRVANGTATSITNYITGSFVPSGAGIQPTIDFKELEFANGIFVETAGTIELTVNYDTLI